MSLRIVRVRTRIAAVAPPAREESPTETYHRRALEPQIDQMASDWAHWALTRKFYGRPPQAESILAQFGKFNLRTTNPTAGPNSVASAVLSRFHQAVISEDSTARAAFEGFYLYRVRPIKKLAHLLQCDRTHVYWLRNQYARRCFAFATKQSDTVTTHHPRIGAVSGS